MSSQAVATSNKITLKGSAQIVSEFFHHAVNSILFQRAIYPPETFQAKKYRGISVMTSKDASLNEYLATVAEQITAWLETGLLQRLVLVISSLHSKEVLERWTFDVDTDRAAAAAGTVVGRPDKELAAEMGSIIRQITASITFLPLLDEQCTFDLLVYTDKSSSVPAEWEESDARQIVNGADVKLRCFNTKIHKVDTSVSYKVID